MTLLEIPFAYREALGRLIYAHSPLTIGLFGLAVVFFFSWLVWRQSAASRLSTVSRWALSGACWLFIAATLGMIVIFTVFPGFIWYTDVPVPTLSFLLLKGFPLYHNIDSPERYALLYGPNLYLLTDAFYLLCGFSAFAAKMPFAVLMLAMLVVVAFIARTWLSAPTVAVAGFLLLLVYDLILCAPILILPAIVAHWLYYFSKWRFRPILIGLCLGLACGAKIHGGFYFLPILFDLFVGRKLFDLLLLSLTALVVMGAPFLLPGIELGQYIFWLRAAAAHGISISVLQENLDWLAYLLSLVLAVLIIANPRSRGMDNSHSLLFVSKASRIGAIVATLVILIIASKPGARFHHLFPLVPVFVILVAPLAQKLKEGAEKTGRSVDLRVLASIYLTGMLLFSLITLGRAYFEAYRIPVRAIASDLHEISARHPTARIALGDAEITPGECLSRPGALGRTVEPLLLYAGHPFVYDFWAILDMQKSGIPIPEQTIDRLRDGSINLWLFPKGRSPFNVMSLYDSTQPLFPAGFREAFFAHYSREETSQFYDVWAFHSSSPQSGKSSPAP